MVLYRLKQATSNLVVTEKECFQKCIELHISQDSGNPKVFGWSIHTAKYWMQNGFYFKQQV